MIIPPDQLKIERISGDFTKADIRKGVKELNGIVGEFDGVFGGYGWHQLKDIPIDKILTRWEKREIKKAEGLASKGIYEPLYRRYGTTNPEIVRKVIIATAMQKPREFQATRRGVRLVLSKPSKVPAEPMAGPESKGT